MTSPSPEEARVCDVRLAGDPMPSPRPRFRVGRSGQVTTYMGKDYEAHLDALRWAMVAGRKPSGPVDAPVDVAVTFYRGTRVRVDIDNLLKTVMDAANEVLWTDDHLVERVTARKVLGVGARCQTRLVVRLMNVAPLCDDDPAQLTKEDHRV